MTSRGGGTVRASLTIVISAVMACVLLGGCGGAPTDAEDAAPQTSPTSSSVDWLELLPDSRASLTDEAITDLTARLGAPSPAEADDVPILVPQFSEEAAGLLDRDQSETLGRLEMLFEAVRDRESRPAVTAAEPRCEQVDEAGECERLEVRFRCPRCASSASLAPMVVHIGDGAGEVRIDPGYAARIANDRGDPRIFMLNEATDDVTARAIERASRSSAAAADEIAHLVPGRVKCIRFFCALLP